MSGHKTTDTRYSHYIYILDIATIYVLAAALGQILIITEAFRAPQIFLKKENKSKLEMPNHLHSM